MDAPSHHAALLGIIQGITEFLPISSDGHLALAEMLFGFSEGGLTLNVMLHAGTLIATLIVLRQRVQPAVVDGVKACVAPSRFSLTAGGRDALVVIVCSLPTAIIGLLLRDAVERWTKSPLVLGLGFVGTALALISTRWVQRGQKETPSVVGSLAVGVCQGLAVLPGLSRSGSTIAALLWLGVRPDRAFELSMLMSLPAVFGALLLEGRHMAHGMDAVAPAAVGAAVSLVVGVAALLVLRRVVMRGHFAWFAAWVLPVALATLFWVRPAVASRAPAAVHSSVGLPRPVFVTAPRLAAWRIAASRSRSPSPLRTTVPRERARAKSAGSVAPV